MQRIQGKLCNVAFSLFFLIISISNKASLLSLKPIPKLNLTHFVRNYRTLCVPSPQKFLYTKKPPYFHFHFFTIQLCKAARSKV